MADGKLVLKMVGGERLALVGGRISGRWDDGLQNRW